MQNKQDILKNIPSVDELIKEEKIQVLMGNYPRMLIMKTIREHLSYCRQRILDTDIDKVDMDLLEISNIVEEICKKTKKAMRKNLKYVINATGVVIHTNLGRSPLSFLVLDDLKRISSRYSNLEMDLDEGIRGSRYDHVEEILKELTKAESAMVVNNNAAAVMLVLSTMAKDKEVIVSRGQLVEIGGSFRIPDVMESSGASMIEVGTTNKTHIYDYERAIGENTAALMKVHTSNYRILGFTEEVDSQELVALGKKHAIPLIEDLGSGVLIDLTKYGLPYEPTVQNSIASGMDIVSFSGDKMLGGPQAGIIVGKKEFIDKMKKNPLTRAFRIDKMTLAALEGTLKLYLDPEKAIKQIPVLRMLTEDTEILMEKAEILYEKLEEKIDGDLYKIEIEDGYSEVGGGSMPLHKLPTKLLTIQAMDIGSNILVEYMRNYDPPIITRISKDKIIIDMRTIYREEIETIVESIDSFENSDFKL